MAGVTGGRVVDIPCLAAVDILELALRVAAGVKTVEDAVVGRIGVAIVAVGAGVRPPRNREVGVVEPMKNRTAPMWATVWLYILPNILGHQ